MAFRWHRAAFRILVQWLLCAGIWASGARAQEPGGASNGQPGGAGKFETSDEHAIAPARTEAVAPQRDLAELLKRFVHEPSVQRVVALALHATRSQQANLDSLSTRARVAGLLPKVNVSARHGQGLDLSTQQNTTSDQLRVGNDEDLTLYAALTFDLPRLVFAREEVALARQRRAQAEAEQALAAQVIALYFERRRAQLAVLSARSEGKEEADLQLRIEELSATLDAFTAGEFSRIISSSGRSPNRQQSHPYAAPEVHRRATDAP